MRGGSGMSSVLLHGVGARKVTLPFTAEPANDAVRCFISATVECKVAVTVPRALVTPVVGASVLPVPVLERVTFWLAMGLPKVSATVTVIVLLLVPSAGRALG